MGATRALKREDAGLRPQRWWPDVSIPLAGVVLWPFIGAAMVVLAAPPRRAWLAGAAALLFVVSVIQLVRTFTLRERRLLEKSKAEPNQTPSQRGQPSVGDRSPRT